MSLCEQHLKSWLYVCSWLPDACELDYVEPSSFNMFVPCSQPLCSMNFFATEVNEVSKTQGKRMLNLHGTPYRDLISLFHREAMCAC